MTRFARSQLTAGNIRLVLPINPYTGEWGYQHNTASTDTIGGRVIQLLSVQVTDLTVTSVTGSRRELQLITDGIRDIMGYHVKTSLAAVFTVPSRDWRFRVYIKAMPQITWDIKSTAYPYQLQMAIAEDLTGVKSKQILKSELARLSEGIGYSDAFHGGQPKAFLKVVDSVLAAKAQTGGSGGGTYSTGVQTDPTSSGFGGKGGLWPANIANAPWAGKSLQDEIHNIWMSVFGASVANRMLCIAQRESGFHPDAHNSYGSPIHHVYGLYQISDVHKAASWWPTSGVSGTNGGLMYDPEYNTRSAMTLYQETVGGLDPWASTSSKCPTR